MKFDLTEIELSSNDKKRNLKLPIKPSKELAEFIGLMTGDGCISLKSGKNQVRITGNSVTDFQYLNFHVSKLLFDLFNIESNILKRKNKNAIVIPFSSKGFVSFMGLIGYYKHTNKIEIPNWIVSNPQYMVKYIRGLIDTDGSVFVSNKKGSPNYPCIELTTICLNLAESVAQFLNNSGFRVPKVRGYKYKHSENISYKVSLYGWNNLTKWIEKIGFSNDYKLGRAKQYSIKKKSGDAGI